MTRPPFVASSLLASALALGCLIGIPGNDTQTSTTSTTGGPSGSVTGAPVSTTDETVGDSAPTMATASTGLATSTGTASTGACGFLCNDMPAQCDNWAQDCPEGQKCAAYAPDGGNAWNAVKCVDVIGTDKPGEPCTSQDVANGVDSCIEGAMCWGTDMNGDGICVAQCSGSDAAPVCDAPYNCHMYSEGALNLCLQDACDPLLQDCLLLTEACYPVGDSFSCSHDASGEKGQANDPCEFPTVCEPGLMCGDAAFVGMGCAEGPSGCCTPFCKFPDGTCPNPDQVCVQWFDPMMFPENDPRLDIGFCGVPG